MSRIGPFVKIVPCRGRNCDCCYIRCSIYKHIGKTGRIIHDLRGAQQIETLDGRSFYTIGRANIKMLTPLELLAASLDQSLGDNLR